MKLGTALSRRLRSSESVISSAKTMINSVVMGFDANPWRDRHLCAGGESRSEEGTNDHVFNDTFGCEIGFELFWKNR